MVGDCPNLLTYTYVTLLSYAALCYVMLITSFIIHSFIHSFIHLKNTNWAIQILIYDSMMSMSMVDQSLNHVMNMNIYEYE